MLVEQQLHNSLPSMLLPYKISDFHPQDVNKKVVLQLLRCDKILPSMHALISGPSSCCCCCCRRGYLTNGMLYRHSTMQLNYSVWISRTPFLMMLQQKNLPMHQLNRYISLSFSSSSMLLVFLSLFFFILLFSCCHISLHYNI